MGVQWQRGELVAYQYVVLRCVPRVEREEFVNVGVALHSQEADLVAVAAHVDDERMRCLWPDADLPGLHRGLATVRRVASGDDLAGMPHLTTGFKRFGWISAPRSTVLQPGPVHTGVTRDPANVVDRLLHRYVL